MAKTKGTTALIEDYIVNILADLTDSENEEVFRTCEVYNHQLEGGIGKIESFAPLAFVSYFPFSPTREGDFDLNDRLRFSVLIAATSKVPGIARRGDNNHLGASRMRDLVINALDKSAPVNGSTVLADEMYYSGENELADCPKIYATELMFTANKIFIQS